MITNKNKEKKRKYDESNKKDNNINGFYNDSIYIYLCRCRKL